MNRITTENLHEAFTGTILEPVIAMMLSGEFGAAPDETVKEKDRILGELTIFEKAIYTVANNIADTHNTAVKSMRKSDEHTFDEVLAKNHVETHELLKSLFWRSVKGRLAIGEGADITVREGYVVVETENNPLGGMLFEMLMSSMDLGMGTRTSSLRGFGMMGPLTGMMMEGMGSPHDCTNCPTAIYDGCPLPFKKPRE